jgi:hypothetical protein
MMERYKGYWISGSVIPGPPNTSYLELLGTILEDGRGGSVVEIGRIRDPGITFDLAGLAEFYGLEISQLFVDHCLPQP